MTADLVSVASTPPVHEWIREYYGTVLSTQEDLRTNACCVSGEPEPWLKALLANVHDDVLARFYGCGSPLPEGIEGRVVLDLGCGSGRDVFVLSQLVGASGQVHGVDMTEEQLAVAVGSESWHRERFGHADSNVRFHHGYIEALESLPLSAGSVDAVVSNCVVNLSPRKDLVLSGAYRLLESGGEFLLSDVFADRRLPESATRDPELLGECLGGASYLPDFLLLARQAGFRDVRVVREAPIAIESSSIRSRLGSARFRSVTLRMFKLDGLEDRCEDYGQVATYSGTLPNFPEVFWLDDHHAFEAGRPERVCGNTASMLTDTRLGEHFTVQGDRAVHFGAFPCAPTLAARDRSTDASRNVGVTACC